MDAPKHGSTDTTGDLPAYLKKWGDHLLILRGMSPKSVTAYQQYVIEFFRWYGAYRESQAQLQGGSGGDGADPPGRSYHISEISRKDIEKYLEHLYFDAGNANSTRKVKLITLGSFWRWLLYEEYVAVDATHGIPSPIVRTRLIQSFTREEVLRMFKKVDIYSAMGIRDAAALILMAFAGLRVGEMCALRMEDLVDDGDYVRVRIPEDIGKKGSSRVVDLWKAPSVFLRQWLTMRIAAGAKNTSHVMVSFRQGDIMTGNPLHPRQVDRLVKNYADAAGIKKTRITSHMFRATHASDLRYIRGYDIAAIAHRLGHKNISTTDRYLPQRGRLKKEYPSLRDYWREWETVWPGGMDAE